MSLRRRAAAALFALAVLSAPAAGRAFRNVEIGEVLENATLPTLAGGSEPYLGDARANVFVFFRPNQDHSIEALKQMATCERELEGKRVRWVAIVSDAYPAPEVREAVERSGIRMSVLVDRGDALYGRLGVKLHPSVGIADDAHRLVAYEPFRKIHYCEVVRARIRFLLGEIDAAQLETALRPPAATIPSGNEATARRYVALGQRQLEAREYEKALESARRGLEADPGLAAAHALRGAALAGLGRCADAIRALDEALALDPRDPAALEWKRRCEAK